MTIASEITRLQWAKADIKTSIENKGVTVPSNAKLDDYSNYVDQITQGNPFMTTMPIRYILAINGSLEYRAWISCPTAFVYWDYMFWTVAGSRFNSSYDYFEANFLVYKNWWTDIKYKTAESWSTRDSYYNKKWGYSINWNNITIGLGYSTSSSTEWNFSTLTATFNMQTGERTGTGTGSTADLTIKWNELFSSIEFDPKIYNFYGTETPVVIFYPKQS